VRGAALQAFGRNFEHALRQLPHGGLAERRLEGRARHAIAHRLTLGSGPVLDHVPGGIERDVVVENADPERRQAADAPPGAAVGAAHFEEFLEPHFRENGGEVIGPIRHLRLDVRHFGDFVRQEIAKTPARQIDVFAVAIDEIHRHIEHVIDIALEAHAGLEHPRQHAGAVVVDIGPDLGAIGQEPVVLAFAERRIGEQGGRHRLQRQGDAEFLDHVGFGGEVEIDLHRAGAEHHLFAIAADLRHVALHDLVAAFRHRIDFRQRPGRRIAEADGARPDLGGHLAHLLLVDVHLGTGLVHRFQGRARQLELAARLQTDPGAVLGQADDVLAFQDRLPAELLHAFEQRLDAGNAFVAQRVMGLQAVDEFLVLGADAPILARLAAFGQIPHEVVARLDRPAGRLRNGHGNLVG
jgi:hypothetical protein